MALTSSAQICVANSPDLPLTAREPVSAIEKPIVIGSPPGAFVPGAAVWAMAPCAAKSSAAKAAKIFFAIMFPPMS